MLHPSHEILCNYSKESCLKKKNFHDHDVLDKYYHLFFIFINIMWKIIPHCCDLNLFDNQLHAKAFFMFLLAIFLK